jgi:hypothetical protein
MARDWIWVGKYIFVIVVALVLGVVLGNLALFRAATLGSPRLTAAALARFIAYGGALGLLWLLGKRASEQLRDAGGGAASLATPLISLATLIVVPSAYAVLMQLIRPFVSRDLRPFIDWTFIVGTIAAAIWLVWALFTTSDALLQGIGSATSRKKPDA